MKAGEFRHPIVIQRATPGDPDPNGQRTPAWQTLGRTWAKIETPSGSEVQRDRMSDAKLQVLITSREFIEGVMPRDRVVCGAVRFEILAVRDEEGRRRSLKLDCVEQV